MKILNYDQAHDFVGKNKHAYWDGWELVIWRKNDLGAMHKRGLFRNGSWGMAYRYAANADGLWRLPNKHA